MTYEEYRLLFDQILDTPENYPRYIEEEHIDYVKLNRVRHDRWMKNGLILDELELALKNIDEDQHWLLITEPWCGDAAHCTPFIYLMSKLSDKIKLEVVLRDSDHQIDAYLTNGSRSIPKLIVRDQQENDLFTWGPRPTAGQDFFESTKIEQNTLEDRKVLLQKWYNENKGLAIQQDILGLMNA